jgi:hypothetical protein
MYIRRNLQKKDRKPKSGILSFKRTEKKKGLTPLELSIIIGTICIFFLVGAYFFKKTSRSAYDITAKHDLQEFADFQTFYYRLNKRCIGEQGQSVRNDGIPSDLTIENYDVSDGVCITIVAGDPLNPNNSDNPYTIQAKHAKSNHYFEFNFYNGYIAER